MLSTKISTHFHGSEHWSITNDGQDIASTDYWSSSAGRTGIYFLSGNAGALRLLVPDRVRTIIGSGAFPMFRMEPTAGIIAEMRTGKRVALEPSIGLPDGKHLDIVFHDGTKRPFYVTLSEPQAANIFWDGSAIPFTVWTSEGCAMRSTITLDPRVSFGRAV